MVTAFNGAFGSFQCEVDEAVSALASLVSDAPRLHLFTLSFSSQIIAALAGHTAVVVVGLAVVNDAMAVLQGEQRVALLADMIHFLLAAENGVFHAVVVVKTEALSAAHADCSVLIGEFVAIFDCFQATSSIEEIILINKEVPEAQFMQIPRPSFSRQPITLDY